VVSVGIVELITQFLSREGGQVAASIDKKLRLGDVVFLGEAVEKCRRRVSAAAAVNSNLQDEFRASVDRGVEPFRLTIYPGLCLLSCDP